MTSDEQNKLLQKLGIAPEQHDDRLFADTMERARIGATGGLYAGIAVAITYALLFYESADRFFYWLWIGAFTLHILFRAPQLLNPIPREPAAVRQWARRSVLGLVIAGSLWGLFAMAFFPMTDSAGRYLLTATQYVVAIMSVAAFSWYPRAFAAFITPLFLLMALPWFVYGSSHAWVIFALNIATYLVLLTYVFRNSTVLIEGLALRYEREALLAQLVLRTNEAERANLSKTRFLASASHDLRQPLHALGLLSAHVVSVSRDASIAPVLQQMQNMARVVGELADALLDISRLDSGIVQPVPQTFKLQDVLDGVIEDAAILAQSRNLTLRVRRTAHWVATDPVMLARIVQNLLANAIRYTNTGGIMLATRLRAGKLSIEVWDTGIGISEAKLARIFEEFVQLNNPARDRNQGLGLGLAIVTRLTKLLGGDITVRSRLGRGSVFTLRLPKLDLAEHLAAAASPVFAPTYVQDEAITGAHILLIEDDEAVREATYALLRGWGCHVQLAADLQSALAVEALSAHAIDIVITDHRLGAHSGIEIANALRARCEHPLPVMVVTGDMYDNIDLVSLAEPYALLAKPLAAISLRAALTQLLKARVK